MLKRFVAQKCSYLLLTLGLITSNSGFVYATDLMDIYRQALENDPTFKAAYSTYMSECEVLPQAWSALLPQLTLSAVAGRKEETVHSALIDIQQPYGSNEWSVTASQNIFNFQAWSQVQQAKASVKASLARFNDAAQDLILRTTSAYLQLLLAKDTLSYAEAKHRANERQLTQAKERFNVGVDTITSVYEAQAAYDQSSAQVISAQNNLINQNEMLSKITNHTYEQVAMLRDSKIPLIKPEPYNADDWVATGLRQNYNLFAARYRLQASRENIKAQTAGNWPIFSIRGKSITTNNDTGLPYPGPLSPTTPLSSFVNNIFIPSKESISSVGITMNFPVFQGGLVLSKTKQAQYDFQTSSEQVEKVYRDVVVNSRIAFNTIKDGISKVLADRKTVISQQRSLDSVYEQYTVGTRTMTDVVNAQQNLYQAQNQLAADQYGLINSILNLKYLAGTLNVNDIEEINAWLATTRVNGVVPAQTSRS